MFGTRKAIKDILVQDDLIGPLIKVLSFLAIIGSIYELNWMFCFVSFLAFALSFLPDYLKRRHDIVLPRFLQGFIMIFIFAGLILGDVSEFYIIFPWWDMLLHLLSGVALGFIGFLVLYAFNRMDKFQASPGFFAILSFCFALALGAIWEIFEFSVDGFFGIDTQTSRGFCEAGAAFCDTRLGLIDTMRDLILDSVGAIVASLIGYLHLKKRNFSFFLAFIREFEERNKHLFRRRRRWMRRLRGIKKG